MIRTREQRRADRDWCNQFMDESTYYSFWDGLILAVAIGAGVWIAFSLLLA